MAHIPLLFTFLIPLRVGVVLLSVAGIAMKLWLTPAHCSCSLFKVQMLPSMIIFNFTMKKGSLLV